VLQLTVDDGGQGTCGVQPRMVGGRERRGRADRARSRLDGCRPAVDRRTDGRATRPRRRPPEVIRSVMDNIIDESRDYRPTSGACRPSRLQRRVLALPHRPHTPAWTTHEPPRTQLVITSTVINRQKVTLRRVVELALTLWHFCLEGYLQRIIKTGKP